ncbi:MAG: hypothetical protein ACI36Z_02635 [Alloprevotella sp.]
MKKLKKGINFPNFFIPLPTQTQSHSGLQASFSPPRETGQNLKIPAHCQTDDDGRGADFLF